MLDPVERKGYLQITGRPARKLARSIADRTRQPPAKRAVAYKSKYRCFPFCRNFWFVLKYAARHLRVLDIKSSILWPVHLNDSIVHYARQE